MNTPWTTRQALQHLCIRVEAALLYRGMLINLRLLERVKHRLQSLAQQEKVMRGETVLVVRSSKHER